MTFNMYPQHADEGNRFRRGGSENKYLHNPGAVFNDKNLIKELENYLGDRHTEEQPSGDRHSRPLEDHNDREQPSGDRHSRPLTDPDGGEQPSGDKTSESEAGK